MAIEMWVKPLFVICRAELLNLLIVYDKYKLDVILHI